MKFIFLYKKIIQFFIIFESIRYENIDFVENKQYISCLVNFERYL